LSLFHFPPLDSDSSPFFQPVSSLFRIVFLSVPANRSLGTGSPRDFSRIGLRLPESRIRARALFAVFGVGQGFFSGDTNSGFRDAPFLVSALVQAGNSEGGRFCNGLFSISFLFPP
jgi:hypothetical protein